jgi:hypothetical protein
VLDGDPVAQVPGVGQVTGIAGHPAQAAGVHLGLQAAISGSVAAAARSSSRMGATRGHLGGQAAPAADDGARIGLGQREAGAVLSAGELVLADRADQARLAAEAVVDRLDRDLFGRDPGAEQGAQVFQRACVSAEFRAFAAGQSSPVIGWLRALARQAVPAPEPSGCASPGTSAASSL